MYRKVEYEKHTRQKNPDSMDARSVSIIRRELKRRKSPTATAEGVNTNVNQPKKRSYGTSEKWNRQKPKPVLTQARTNGKGKNQEGRAILFWQALL